MAATPSTSLDPAARFELLRTATSAIECGLGRVEVAPPDPAALAESLRRVRASFVTLTIEGDLRGCCGTLDPVRPLALDVWRNAQATAFRDPRFAPLTRTALISQKGGKKLLRRAIPGRDGLVLCWRGASATFLPKVWEQLNEPREFVRHLKLKAGWSAGFWSEEIEAWRYDTELVRQSRPAQRAGIQAT